MSIQAPIEVASPPEVGAPLLSRLAARQRRTPIAQIVVLVALFVYGAASIPGFDSRGNLYEMLVLASYLGMASVGQTLVLLIGGIDFSIPAFIVLGETMLLELISSGWPIAAAMVLSIVVALMAGGAIGYLCHRFQVQSLIVTLGASAIVTGVIEYWTNGGLLTGTPPAWLSSIASPSGTIFGLAFPPMVVIWAIVAIVVGVVLSRTVAGKRLYATGTNLQAADLSLVRTGRVWIAAFALSAAFSVLLGFFLAGFAGGDLSAGDPYLFESLATVIVGGTAFGGQGDYWRTVIGALLLTFLTTILVGHGLSTGGEQVVYGALVFVIVGGYGREVPLRDRI